MTPSSHPEAGESLARFSWLWGLPGLLLKKIHAGFRLMLHLDRGPLILQIGFLEFHLVTPNQTEFFWRQPFIY